MNNIEPKIGWYLYDTSRFKNKYYIAQIYYIDNEKRVCGARVIGGNNNMKNISCSFMMDDVIFAETLEQLNKILVFK